MDQVGHGERRRRTSPRREPSTGGFRDGRQDYFFRYVSGPSSPPPPEGLAGRMAGT